MTNSPKISVVMCAYNAEEWIERAVDSILNQSFDDFEFLIVDDGSTDGTSSILDEYERQDARVTVIRHENQGVPKSANKAIRRSSGEYIARMDADDESLPDRFEKQVKFLDAHPDYGMVGASRKIIEANGIEREEYFPETDEEIKRYLPWGNPFNQISVMIRRDVLDEVGLYDEYFTYSSDYELWSRIATQYKAYNLQDVLVIRYEHDTSMTNALANQLEKLKYFFIIQHRTIQRGNYSLVKYFYFARPVWLVTKLILKKLPGSHLIRRWLYSG